MLVTDILNRLPFVISSKLFLRTSDYWNITLLIAYLDESGIHAGAEATLVAGFVGLPDDWEAIASEWESKLDIAGISSFHYNECKAGTGEFAYKETWVREWLVSQLAKLLAGSPLKAVIAGFRGDWNSAISQGTEWDLRFPSTYHFAFEMCIEQIKYLSSQYWDHKPVTLVFSRQDEYESRAREIWQTFQANRLWSEFDSFSFGQPRNAFQLQAADMIAYEAYQYLISSDGDAWRQWPLLTELFSGTETVVGGVHDETTFVEMMRRSEVGGRKYLKRPPKD